MHEIENEKMDSAWQLTFDLSPVVSTQPTSEDHRGEEEKEGEADSSTGAMSHTKVSSRGEVC